MSIKRKLNVKSLGEKCQASKDLELALSNKEFAIFPLVLLLKQLFLVSQCTKYSITFAPFFENSHFRVSTFNNSRFFQIAASFKKCFGKCAIFFFFILLLTSKVDINFYSSGTMPHIIRPRQRTYLMPLITRYCSPFDELGSLM